MTDPRGSLFGTIRFEGVTIEQGPGRVSLAGVDFDFPLDQNVWIKASNGSGKSQLLRVLGGLDVPLSGRYLVNDQDVTSMSFEEFLPYQRRVGFGFEYGGLLSNRTVAQNLMLPFLYHRDIEVEEAEKRVEEYASLFGLSGSLGLRPASCSGGNRKAACVLRALITRPELLLLDHPTAGLDENRKRKLIELLRRHREEHGLRHVFIVSEDERFMERLGFIELDISDHKLKLAGDTSQEKAA